MQIGEAAFSPFPVGDKKKEKKKEKEKEQTRIRFSLFFDGTLNNRTNIEQRLLASGDATALTTEEQEKAVELKEKASKSDLQAADKSTRKYGGEDTSYGGYFTNVEKMERYIAKAEGYPHTFSTYVEGPGTSNKEKDRSLGYAFGTNATGVAGKVEKGMADVVKKIKKKIKETIFIEELILDVFGFSRGAAGARYFIFQALKGEDSIKKRLKEQGYTVKKVEVHFAGLYDTVHSYGYGMVFGLSDVKSLKPDAVRLVKKKVVQLVAADEHRKNFSLTNIQSAGTMRGCELFLPGVHSDIGGGYRDAADEGFLIYEALEAQARAEQKRLIASGWYRNTDELEFKPFVRSLGRHTFKMGALTADRKAIGNQYSVIPLHIMADFAREHKMSIKDKMERDEKISPALNVAKQKIDAYVAQKREGGSTAADWLEAEKCWHELGWLKDLRHNYLHFSARFALGHKPRLDSKGQRYRLTYQG